MSGANHPTPDKSAAFPIFSNQEEDGLTKRELFAAMAMQGLCTLYPQCGDFMQDHVAEGAVKLADALLRELAK